MICREDLAWAAGLFEGEGTVTRCGGVPRLALKMTDLPIVRRFADVIQFGVLLGPYGPYERPDGYKRQAFLYWVATGDDGLLAAELLEPWLGERRRGQIDEHYGAREKVSA